MRIVLIAPNSRPEVIGISKADLADLQMTASPSEVFYAPRGNYDLAVTARLLKDHDVFIINAQDDNLSNDELLKQVSDLEPDFIGLVSTANPRCYILTDKHIINASNALKGIAKIILMGTHGSLYPESYSSFADYVIIGEYEQALPVLLDEIEAGKITMQGVAHREGGKFTVNKGTNHASMEQMPIPDYSFINTDCKSFALAYSRGCPFNCSFCVKTVPGFQTRYRKAADVVSEIALLKERGVTHIDFVDELFNTDPEKVEELCGLIKKENLLFTYSIQTRADFLNDEVIKLMKETGCVRIDIGLETGDPAIMARIGKALKLEQVENAAKLIKENGLEMRPFLIIGLPGENAQTVENTIRFVKKLNCREIGALIATPFPGSRVYEEAKALNVINGDELVLSHEWEKLAKYSGTIDTKFSKKQIRELLKNFRMKYQLNVYGLGFLYPIAKHVPIKLSYNVARKIKYALGK